MLARTVVSLPCAAIHFPAEPMRVTRESACAGRCIFVHKVTRGMRTCSRRIIVGCRLMLRLRSRRGMAAGFARALLTRRDRLVPCRTCGDHGLLPQMEGEF